MRYDGRESTPSSRGSGMSSSTNSVNTVRASIAVRRSRARPPVHRNMSLSRVAMEKSKPTLMMAGTKTMNRSTPTSAKGSSRTRRRGHGTKPRLMAAPSSRSRRHRCLHPPTPCSHPGPG